MPKTTGAFVARFSISCYLPSVNIDSKGPSPPASGRMYTFLRQGSHSALDCLGCGVEKKAQGGHPRTVAGADSEGTGAEARERLMTAGSKDALLEVMRDAFTNIDLSKGRPLSCPL